MQIMTRAHAQVIVCLPKEEPEVMARERDSTNKKKEYVTGNEQTRCGNKCAQRRKSALAGHGTYQMSKVWETENEIRKTHFISVHFYFYVKGLQLR